MSTAVLSARRGTARLDACKSWVTSAGHADSYVWSSRPLRGRADDTVAGAGRRDGLSAAGAFDGLGLRGNASAPLTADGLEVPLSAMLGTTAAGSTWR